MTWVDWICLALTLGSVAGLLAWQMDAAGWIARRVRARRETREAPRWTAPDNYDEKDWTP